MAPSTRAQRQAPFLRLPIEIRWLIYEFIIAKISTTIFPDKKGQVIKISRKPRNQRNRPALAGLMDACRGKFSPPLPRVFLTSTELRSEVKKCYFSHTFQLECVPYKWPFSYTAVDSLQSIELRINYPWNGCAVKKWIRELNALSKKCLCLREIQFTLLSRPPVCVVYSWLAPDWKLILEEVLVSSKLSKLITNGMPEDEREKFVDGFGLGYRLGQFLHMAGGQLSEWFDPEIEFFSKLPEVLREFPALKTVRVLGYHDDAWRQEIAAQGFQVEMEF